MRGLLATSSVSMIQFSRNHAVMKNVIYIYESGFQSIHKNGCSPGVIRWQTAKCVAGWIPRQDQSFEEVGRHIHTSKAKGFIICFQESLGHPWPIQTYGSCFAGGSHASTDERNTAV